MSVGRIGNTAFLAVLCCFFAISASYALAQENNSPQEADTAGPSNAESLREAPDAVQQIEISIDELRAMLKKGQTPRVSVKTRFSKVKGQAVRTDDKKVYVDVSQEQVAVAGVVGTPISLVDSIKVLVPLTKEERQAVAGASERYLKALTASKQEEMADEAIPPPVEGAEPAVQAQEAEAVSTDPEKRERDLLELYPPSQGWGPGRVFEITRKRIVLGLNPFGKDKSFVEDYDAWVEAYNRRREQQLKMKNAMEADGQELPENFELLPELEPVGTLEGAAWQDEQ